MDSCGCPAGRPLGAPHLPTCETAKQSAGDISGPAVVSIYRNLETGRPVVVPDEVASEAERDYRAWKKHTSGVSWGQIAEEELYDSPRQAAESVRRYLDEAVAVVQDFTREQMIADHVGRLQMLRQALWTGAMLGKTTSVMTVLAVEDRWVKAFGLDQADEDDAMGQTVVVVDQTYLDQLKAAAELQDAEEKGEPEANAG